MNYRIEDFDVKPSDRQAIHRPSGITFNFYEYHTPEDWAGAMPSFRSENPLWRGDGLALAVAAKEAAVASGMAHRTNDAVVRADAALAAAQGYGSNIQVLHLADDDRRALEAEIVRFTPVAVGRPLDDARPQYRRRPIQRSLLPISFVEMCDVSPNGSSRIPLGQPGMLF